MAVGKGNILVVVMPTVMKVFVAKAAFPCDFAIVAAWLYQALWLFNDSVYTPENV